MYGSVHFSQIRELPLRCLCVANRHAVPLQRVAHTAEIGAGQSILHQAARFGAKNL